MIQAAYDGDETVFNAKIAAGANIEAVDSEGYTALIYATAYGYQDIMKTLIADGANVTAFKNDVNPMFAAVNNDNTSSIQMLIDAGADVNCVDLTGYTPLMFAAQEGYSATVSFLLAKGAKVDTEDNDGHTATSIAAQNNHNDVVEILLLSNPKKAGYSKYANSPINTADYVENKDGERKLVDYGMDRDYDAGIGYFSTGVGLHFTPYEVLSTVEVGVHERAFKIDLYGGIATEKYTADFNFFSKDNIIKATSIYYASLGKKFELYQKSTKIEFGLSAGINGMYAIGKYTTTLEESTQLLYGFSAGVYLSTSYGVFRFNYNPMLNPQTDFFRHRFSASLNVKLFKYTNSDTFTFADKTLYML
jgi:ankyrin repeat protein